MPEGTSYADIVILALIAGFILLRLRSVLGDKIGNDSPGYFNKPVAVSTAAVVQIDDKSVKAAPTEDMDPYLQTLTDSAVIDAINAIKAKDPQFTATHFLSGAKNAFEMVFDAFAKGDKETLKMLMSEALLQEFATTIDQHAAQDTRPETTLVSVQAKDIVRATLTGNTAQLTVHFTSEQVRIVRDKKGAIVEGDASEIHHAEDHWLFERDIGSKNPNWKIIET